LAFVLTLVILAVNAAVSARSSAPVRAQETQAYLDRVRPLVERSAQQGTDVGDARANAGTLGRDGINRRFERVERDAGLVLTDARKVKPPSSARDANGLLLAALAIRAQAASALKHGMNDALGTVPPATAVSELVDAGRSMMAGDQAFQLFVGALPKSTNALTAAPWQADPDAWGAPALTVLVTSVRNAFSQTPVHDLQVMLVSVEPTSVGTDGPNAVLPPARNLRVSIVVANLGNDTERHVTVSATLSPAAIGPTDVARDFVDLAPGQRRTVVLGTLRPAVGPPSAVTARIDPVAGETAVSDNEKTFSFVMR
jgi:hypothetical protein